MDVLLIGIAGPSAGGKTTVTNLIRKEFSQDIVTVIAYDDYYKEQSSISLEERYLINYDHPNAFDSELLIKHIKMLKNGQVINKPKYDFVEHNRCKEFERIKATKIIIIEGLFTLLEKEMLELIDIKVYVEADADECFIRRLKRDIKERGRTPEMVMDQYLKTVKPMQERFITPTRKNADVIVLRGGENKVAIEMVTHLINNHLQKGENYGR